MNDWKNVWEKRPGSVETTEDVFDMFCKLKAADGFDVQTSENYYPEMLQQWKDMSLLNYALPGFFVSSALKNMMNKKWGRILLFGGTGTSFRTEYKTNAAYAGAKSGLGILVQSVASNYADYGITCNAIMPGFVDTGYIGPQQKTELAKKMPGGKLIKEESVASAAEFLLSNGDLNGVLLRLDRGLSANLGRNNALNLT